jgi:hypothetical protein
VTIIRARRTGPIYTAISSDIATDQRLSHVAVRVWLRISYYETTGQEFPSRRQLAADLDVSDSGIKRALAELRGAGYLDPHVAQ